MDLESVPPELRESLARWWERAATQIALAEGYAALPEKLRAEMTRAVVGSEFIAAALLQDPQALDWFVRHDDPSAIRAARSEYESRAAVIPTTAETQRVLREWRRREMLRIAWREIAGRSLVEETLHALSDFADASIRAAAAAARLHLEEVFGAPRDENGGEAPLIVLGMGKLGGRELNFSSDIDLVFLFEQNGETDGPRVIENEEYFNRLGRELIRLLDVRNEEGFVFRVDMRLRPFGDSGPLVVSIASLEDYLQQHGRDWERYAWIKARPIVGAAAYTAAYREFVRPFVYRRYLDFGVIESLRDMKALIAREVARRELEQDLKLGRGGIREIEFIVQSMQLIRGGSDRRLQNASLLEVLPLLAGSKLMSAPDVAELTDAYSVLRRAENALQIIRDEQAHSIPTAAIDRVRLALNMGASDWPGAAALLDRVRSNVARQFAALLVSAADPRQDGDGGGTDAMAGGADWLASEDVNIDEELVKSGFAPGDVAAVAATLETYRHAAPYRRLDEAGRRRVHIIVGRLLKAVAQNSLKTGSAQPAVVVERVLRVLEAIGARSSYLALLKEQPAALDRLIDVCAISGFLSRQIADFPLLLDELIDAKAFDELPSRQSFVEALAARTERLPADDAERQVEALRQFQKVAVFTVALADQTGRLPLMKVSDRLTDIAELIIECCMDLAWQQMTETYGVPFCGERADSLRRVRVAVAGYGKLGGLELGYGSDLDLVFLHDSSGDIQQTRADADGSDMDAGDTGAGAKSIDNGVFFLRLGQRIVHLLTMHSAAGRLYEVDMRLRPNGKGGFLMTGIDAFELYQRKEAWTWEHQALLRARAVAGDESLRRSFEAVRKRVLGDSVHTDTLRADVMEMRTRMRRELSKAGAGQFDIKQDAGGIADIEFLVQYWVLAAAHAHPELLTHTDNIRQLEGLASVGVLDPATAEHLTETYIGYRTVLHHLSLEGHGERVVEAARYVDMRARVTAIWRRTFE